MSEGNSNVSPQPIGNPPLNQATLTSHLRNFNPPEQTEDEIAADNLAGEMKDFKLPKTLKGTHELLASLQASAPANMDEAKVKTAKVDLVMAHLGKLGQGTPPTVINFAERKAINDAQSGHADLLKIQVLARTHPEVRILVEKIAGLEKSAKDGSAELALAKAVSAALATAKDLASLKKTISEIEESK